MDAFFRSVARAFGENRDSAWLLSLALLALLAILLAMQAADLWKARRAHRSALLQLCLHHGLSAEDLAFVRALAERASVEPLALLTHLDVFEAVTARSLAGLIPPLLPRDRESAWFLRLRHALGFDRLPPHFPLLTSRELARGTALEVAGHPGEVAAVDEAALTVEARGQLALAPGTRVELSLIHAREARYSLHCDLLAARQLGEGRFRLVFAHDETPARIQLRQYARAAAPGPVALQLQRGFLGAPGTVEVKGELVDVSGGGLQLSCGASLPAGLLAEASFELGGARFAGLRAVVVSSQPAPDGRTHVRLELRDPPEPERERLIAAVTRVEGVLHRPLESHA